MITLKDVAREAGVSIATVSCALSGKKPVRPDTYNKIMDAIEKLKYIPNYSARTLKQTSSKVVSVLLPNMRSSFYSGLFDGISSYLQAHGYSINVAFSNESADIECAKIDEFITQNSAGLLIVTSQPQNTAFFQNHIVNYAIPTVFIDREPEALPVNYIGLRHYDTFYNLTTQLLQKGYQNISIICGPLEFSSERNCVQGCSDAMNSFGLPLSSQNVCVTNMTREDAFSSFLKNYSANPPEALLSTSWEVTCGVQAAMEYCDLHAPANMLLFSYSEESWINMNQNTGAFFMPRNSADLGEKAARILLQNIRDPELFEQVIKEIDTTDSLPALRIPKNRFRSRKAGNPAAVPPKDSLRFLAIDNPTIQALELLTGHFERESGIKVEFHRVPQDELFSMISTSTYELTQRYDLYTYDVPWLEYMAQNMCLADITTFTESEHFKKELFFPSSLRNCQIDNRYFGIPISGGTQLLFYRKDLFDSRTLQTEYQKQSRISLRPPRTWKEFNDVAAFFTRQFNPSSPTEYGASFAGIIDEELAPEILVRLWAYGGKLWDNYHRPTFNTKENHIAFESVLNTLKYTPDHDLSKSIKQTVDDFCAGRTAMLITYSEFAEGMIHRLKENAMGRIDAHIIPGMTPASVGWNIGLNPFSSHRESVFRFFSWLCDINTNVYLTIMNGASTITAPYHNSELLKLYPWLSCTEESLARSVRRNSPYRKNRLVIPTNQIEKILCQALRRILTHNLSVPEALEEAQQAADHLFKTYGYPTTHKLFTL